MPEEILLSQHEFVILGDFNFPNIDWTQQRPTPAPGNKLMQFETARQNNVLELVISTEEELIIVNLKIIDKIFKQAIFNENRKVKYSIRKK